MISENQTKITKKKKLHVYIFAKFLWCNGNSPLSFPFLL